MIVLFNVKISNHRWNVYRRPYLRDYDRYDVFKYCLSSYSVFDELVSKYIFYIDMSEYEDKIGELAEYIYTIYPKEKVSFYRFRNNTRLDWQRSCEETNASNDNLIWFAGNDDHIFLDHNLECLKAGLKSLIVDPNPFSAMFYSHWYETIRVAAKQNAKLDESGYFVSLPWGIHDSIRIVRKELWNHYWFNLALHNSENNYFRTDHIADVTGRDPFVTTYIPTRELCRHFDGYAHVGNLFNHSPPLEIPPNYFENKIKIRYGWDDGYKPEYLNINPCGKNLKCVDPEYGFDFRYTKNRIPLAWKDKIEQFNEMPSVCEDVCENSYKKYIEESVSLPLSCYLEHYTPEDKIPQEWLSKI